MNNEKKNGFLFVFTIILLVIGTPLAFFALTAQAGDCDGSTRIMIFAIPACILYGGGAFVFGDVAAKTQKLNSILGTLICVVILMAILPNLWAAIQEEKLCDSDQIPSNSKPSSTP